MAAQKKYGKLVQVGDQQRSSDYTIRMIQKIHDGLIGEAYMAKSWYANTRGSMGIGKPAPVPDYAQLGFVAGSGAAQRVQGQHSSLQLALAAPLRHRRDAQ